MHRPPAVTYPVARSRFALGVALTLLGAAAAALAVWATQSQHLGWRHSLGAALWGACSLLTVRSWRKAPDGPLAWDGAGWQLAGVAGQLERILDLQARLLVRFRPESGRSAWLWLECASAPADWNALRRAVYSPARTEPPQGAEPPVAGP